MKTKEHIELTALDLFSLSGFAAVSIRDISGAVGIKESSVYNHFKNKQDILDTIIDNFIDKSKKAFSATDLLKEQLIEMMKNKEAIINSSIAMFMLYMQDDYLLKCRKLFTIEQYHNERIRALFCTSFIKNTIDWNTANFEKLIHIGYFKPCNAKVMAYHLYAPIFMMIQECDCNGIDIASAKILVKEHVTQFTQIYLNEVAK